MEERQSKPFLRIPSAILSSRCPYGTSWDCTGLVHLGAKEINLSNFNQRFGQSVHACRLKQAARLQSFSSAISGAMLRDIYSDFGARLLERNVRSFLQARGKVNRGIRDTIAKEPEALLAYNNGILWQENQFIWRVMGSTCNIRDRRAPDRKWRSDTASLLATNRGRADLSECM